MVLAIPLGYRRHRLVWLSPIRYISTIAMYGTHNFIPLFIFCAEPKKIYIEAIDPMYWETATRQPSRESVARDHARQSACLA
jgi:hypothetical protein